MYTNLY